MSIKVGINGFGRIGRNVFKIAEDKAEDFEITVINGISNPDQAAHLLKYDSCFGRFDKEVKVEDGSLFVGGRKITLTNERKTGKFPWAELGVDVVIESTGVMNHREGVQQHLDSGAKKVIISAPGKNEDITIVMGVNEEKYNPIEHNIISNASCTTNCLAPFAKVLETEFGIASGFMTTIHAYTNDQRVLDGTHKDLRRARAAAESIIPTTTGAAKAVALVIPELKGKFNGLAMRVPTPTVSVVDLVCELNRNVTAEEVNAAFKKAANGKMKGILSYSEEPLVSVDYKQDPHSTIIDGLSTMVMEENRAKIIAWYDNEWGYSNRIVDLTEYVVKAGL